MTILKNGSALLIRQIISGGLNIIGMAVASRYLTPNDFSILAIIVPTIALCVMLADLGTSTNILTIEKLPKQSRVNTSYCVRIILFSLIFISAISIINKYALVFGYEDLFYIYLVSILRMSRLQIESFFQRELRWPLIAKVQICEVIIYNITLCVLIYVCESYFAFIICLIIREVTALIIYLKMTSPIKCIKSGFSVISLSDFKFGFVTQLSNFLGVMNTYCNPIIGGKYLSIHEVGIINWSAQVATISRAPFQYLPVLLLSHFSSDNRNGQNSQKKSLFLFLIVTYITLVISTLTIVAIAIMADFINVKWQSALPLLSIYLFENLKFVQANIMTSQMLSNRQTDLVLKVNIFNTCMIYLLCFVGAKLYGSIGFVGGITLASVLVVVYQMKLCKLSTDYNYIVCFSMFISMLVILGVVYNDYYVSIIIYSFSLVLSTVIFYALLRLFFGKRKFKDLMEA